MYFSSLAHLVAYLMGLLFGGLFILLIVRKIGIKGKKSLVWDELFTKITKYKARIINIDNQKPDTSDTNISVKVFSTGDDNKDMLDALHNQLNFPMSLAKETVDYIQEHFGQLSLQDKISECLKYIDSNKV